MSPMLRAEGWRELLARAAATRDDDQAAEVLVAALCRLMMEDPGPEGRLATVERIRRVGRTYKRSRRRTRDLLG